MGLRKLVVWLMAVSSLCLTGPTGAAAPPLVTDARGDSLVPDGRFDILSATVTATRRTLTAQVTLAGPPPTDGTTRVELVARATSRTCRGGTFRWDFVPPSAQVGVIGLGVARHPGMLWIEGCGATSFYTEGSPWVMGNTITWAVRRAAIERAGLLPGTVFDQFRVMTYPTILVGYPRPAYIDSQARPIRELQPPVDLGTSAARYVVP